MHSWAVFRAVRIGLFLLLILSCLSGLGLLCIPMIRGWTLLSEAQRIILVVMAAVDALSAILIYLMMVVYFHLWLDCVRIFLALVLHSGGAVAFTLLKSKLPCVILGSANTCTDFKLAILADAWAVCALLLIYLTLLAIAASMPRPVTYLPDKPSVLLPTSPGMPIQRPPVAMRRNSSIDSRTGLLENEPTISRKSRASITSLHQGGPLYVVNGDRREEEYQEVFPEMESRLPLQPMDHYGSIHDFPIRTPASQSSFAFSMAQAQSLKTPIRPGEGYPLSAMPSPSPYTPAMSSAQTSSRPLPFPNPFRGPPERLSTPDSVHSTSSTLPSTTLHPNGARGHDYSNIPRDFLAMPPHQVNWAANPVQMIPVDHHSEYLLPTPFTSRNPYRYPSPYLLPIQAPTSAPPSNGHMPALFPPTTTSLRAHTPVAAAHSVRSVAPSVHSHASAMPMRTDQLASYTFPPTPPPSDRPGRPPPTSVCTSGHLTRRPLSALLRFERPGDPSQPMYNGPYTPTKSPHIRRFGSVPNGAVEGTQVGYGRGYEAYEMTNFYGLGERRGSDGQVVDHAQWRRLVKDAALGTV